MIPKTRLLINLIAENIIYTHYTNVNAYVMHSKILIIKAITVADNFYRGGRFGIG